MVRPYPSARATISFFVCPGILMVIVECFCVVGLGGLPRMPGFYFTGGSA